MSWRRRLSTRYAGVDVSASNWAATSSTNTSTHPRGAMSCGLIANARKASGNASAAERFSRKNCVSRTSRSSRLLSAAMRRSRRPTLRYEAHTVAPAISPKVSRSTNRASMITRATPNPNRPYCPAPVQKAPRTASFAIDGGVARDTI